MSKPRRRVTVDTGKSGSEESEKRKPSVFERLGPGGAQRKYEERGDKSKGQSQYLDKCRNWLLTGDCPFGPHCKFQHGPFIAKRSSKNRSDDDAGDDLRLKVKGGPERHKSAGSESPENGSASRSRHDKETKIKSTVVVKNTAGLDSDEENTDNSDNWDAEVLDYKKELELEKKRQEIQRALSQLADAEGEERENITIEKKLSKPSRESVSFAIKKNRQLPSQAFPSEYSESESSPDRGKSSPKKSPVKKMSPGGKKKGEKKKHKQKSPVRVPPAKSLRSPSPFEGGKKKEHKKKYDTEDDSPHKGKHKKTKKIDKKHDKSPEPDFPKSKKKHLPHADKFHFEKPPKGDKKAVSPDLGSPTGKRSHKSWSPHSRSRSRSLTPTPTKKQKILSPGQPDKKVKGEKVKQKKKKGKRKLGTDGAKERRVSPVRIKKKKLKNVVPFEIKRDIEEDLPARNSDSPGSENLPRSMTPEIPHKKDPPEREFFRGMREGGKEREDDRRDSGNRKTKRKRSESPPPRENVPQVRGDIGKKRPKGSQSQDRKVSRKDTYGRGEMERQKFSEDRGRRRSPDSVRSEERSPTPVPSDRRTHSPDDISRSRPPRMGRDEEPDLNRLRDRRSPEDRRGGRDSRNRREDIDSRGQRTSADRESYRERFDDHRSDPRERFDEGFQEIPERFQERSRYQHERDQMDSRDRHRQDPSFERVRDNRRDRFDSRDRFQQEQGRMLQGQDRDFVGDHHQPPMRGRGRGRGRGGYPGSSRDRNYKGPDRQEPIRGYQDFDRQSRRSDWEDRHRSGDVFPQGRDWGDRHDMRRDMSQEDRFDSRRDDHRFDEHGFVRDDETMIGRDGRAMTRGNMGRSLDRNVRDKWRGRPDIREERAAMRDDRIREDRMDDRRRDRRSLSPFDKHYPDDRFPHDERMFDDERMRDELPLPLDRGGRGARMRDERDIRGGRDERGMRDRGRGMMGRDDRLMDREGSLDERGRRDRGRDERGMDRGRDERVSDRIRDERGLEEQGFPDDRRRDRGFHDEHEEGWVGREERGFRDGGDGRFSAERIPREERGSQFDRDGRDRRRDDFRDRDSRGEATPEKERTPDRRSHDARSEKDERDRVSRDGSPRDDRSKSSSSRTEKSKEKMSKDDRDTDKSLRDSKSKEEKGQRGDRSKDEKSREEKSDKKKKDEKSKKKGQKSPKKEDKKEEKSNWPPKSGEERCTEAGSGDESRHGGTPSRDTRKRMSEKGDMPLSPIPKRLRDVSPASSSRSRSSQSSRQRENERGQSRVHRRGDSGSDKEEKTRRNRSLDRDKKLHKKEMSQNENLKKKSRSVSPIKEKSEEKAKGRKRSLSGSSSRSQEQLPLATKEKTDAEPEKKDPDTFDEDNISAVVSLGGRSSIADDKGSDRQSIRSTQFSDWSEDDFADNILNQAEAEAEREERRKRSPSRSSRGSRTSTHEKKPADGHDNVVDSVNGSTHAPTDDVNNAQQQTSTADKDGTFDEDLDAFPEYEQISSDEDGFMEEETEKQPSIINILDIDWASLKETKPPKPKGSVLQRFTPASVFSQIGVSRAYAGDELFERIKNLCQKQLEEQNKEECEEDADKEKAEKDAEKFVLHDNVAAFHCSALRKLKERASLLRNIGSHRRALCARKDLEIRRRLCKVDKVFDQNSVYPSQSMDMDLSKLSIQLFRQGRDHTPDKKDDEDVTTELSCSV